MNKTLLYSLVILVIVVIVAIGWTLVTPIGSFSLGGFDFSLSSSPNSGTLNRGQSAVSTITATLTKGRTQNVQLSLSGCPAATTCSLSRTSGNPTFTSTLTIQTSSGTPLGSRVITVNGVGGGKTRSKTYTLTVNPYCPDGVCDSGETCSNCPQDCGACPPICGNGICENGETCSSCQQDCGCQSGYNCLNNICIQQCNCSAWTSGACNAGGCIFQRQQTRICYPSDCDVTSRCIDDSLCMNHTDSCSDSDGGVKFFTQGSVSGYKSNNLYNYSDICIGNITLIEYYCSGTTSLSLNTTCQLNTTTHCVNGACV